MKKLKQKLILLSMALQVTLKLESLNLRSKRKKPIINQLKNNIKKGYSKMSDSTTNYSTSIIKKLAIGANGASYSFDAVKFNGQLADFYATQSDLEELKDEYITHAASALEYMGELPIKDGAYQIPSAADKGNVFVILEKCTLDERTFEPGDLFLCKTEYSEIPADFKWADYFDFVQGDIDYDVLREEFSCENHLHPITDCGVV